MHAEYFGAVIIQVPGRLYPITVEYIPPEVKPGDKPVAQPSTVSVRMCACICERVVMCRIVNMHVCMMRPSHIHACIYDQEML